MAENEQGSRGARKTRKGTVVNRSGLKTVVVRVERRFPHPLYGKVLRRSENYHVHDEANSAKAGDKVEIVECRPMSRMKRWRLVRIIDGAAKVG